MNMAAPGQRNVLVGRTIKIASVARPFLFAFLLDEADHDDPGQGIPAQDQDIIQETYKDLDGAVELKFLSPDCPDLNMNAEV